MSGTSTSSFGVGKREGHDASSFYDRFTPPVISDDDEVKRSDGITESICFLGSSMNMHQLSDRSVALVVTSPPYFVGKDYELAVAETSEAGERAVPSSYLEFLTMLRTVFAECERVLEPGGRIAVNVANLGRKPYRSLSADVIAILQDDLGMLLRGEVIWAKSKASSGSCAWGSFARASNPVIRDNTERVIIASKGRFERARNVRTRQAEGLPHQSTLTNDEFIDVTKDVWEIDAESATRVGHPAPFPVDLPRRLIELYTYVDDVVVDPFCGSGSTLLAASRTSRIGVGYDLEPGYVDLSNQRVADESARRIRIDRARKSGEIDSLEHDERRDAFLGAAFDAKQKVVDIAEQVLLDAGFVVAAGRAASGGAAVRGAGVAYDFTATSADGTRSWYIDVVGAFTTAKSGLDRAEGVWRVLGRLAVLRSIETDAEVIVLAPQLPKPTSPAGKALRAGLSNGLFDVLEILDPASRERLARYAAGDTDSGDSTIR